MSDCSINSGKVSSVSESIALALRNTIYTTHIILTDHVTTTRATETEISVAQWAHVAWRGLNF